MPAILVASKMKSGLPKPKPVHSALPIPQTPSRPSALALPPAPLKTHIPSLGQKVGSGPPRSNAAGSETGENTRCSFLPKFSIHIETKYEDNKGINDNIFGGEPRDEETEVCFVDIVYDEIPERHYKESEDLRYFKSKKTNRGLLKEGWIDTQDPIMCSYKLVTVKFEVWGLQTRVEQFVHKVIRDVLLLGHRQAFAWVDEWIDMTMEEVREYERATQEATNLKIGSFPPAISISETPLPSSTRSGPNSAPSTPLSTEAPEFLSVPKERPRKKSAPETLTLPDPGRRDSIFKLPSFFSWNSSPQPE
ncbi:cytoplasmic phosphatidylinositol transfer protein 1-like isoform X1 [Lates japonicus]|uniref:Cytoplasmic phosphatidylinositol transfer protein 1-like isoform X1 n=1 Tax=Lates japonicus TaxID=270547 RepID=A0AAD3N6U9_LATJO|nr:cytoplasmic phosphatidylinositol transfer protein 1-like isoform X1 [Lates japonicus]